MFESLQEQAAAWDEQAGKTLAIDKAIEYVRTPEVKHTANQWEAADYGKHISNRVYQMRYHISENTLYDGEKEKSVPYSWTLSWSIYTNSPHNYGQAKIAVVLCQEKVQVKSELFLQHSIFYPANLSILSNFCLYTSSYSFGDKYPQ